MTKTTDSGSKAEGNAVRVCVRVSGCSSLPSPPATMNTLPLPPVPLRPWHAILTCITYVFNLQVNTCISIRRVRGRVETY